MAAAFALSSCGRGAVSDPGSLSTTAPFVPVRSETDTGHVLTSGPLGSNIGAVAKYRFSIVLDYSGHRAQVNQLVELANPGPDIWKEIVFHLPIDLRSERFTLSQVSLLEQVETISPQLRVSADNFLTISLPTGVRPHESRLVSITYGLSAAPTTLASRRPHGDVGYNEEIIQFTNWYPQLVPYQPGRGWLRWDTSNVGPPLMAEVADYELEIKAPNGVVVASGGPVGHKGNTWEFMLENARSIAFSASPDYKVRTQTSDSTTLFVYHLPGHSAEAEAVTNAATQSLSLFNEQFGTYPYKSLVIAQNAYLPSVAAGGFILHTGQGFEQYTGHPGTLLIVLLPLTMAQLWWGQIVGHNPISEPWLGAALPMYAEYLFDERYYPNLVAWYWENRIEYWQPEGPVNLTAYDLETTASLLQNVYRQGARFLNSVRDKIGEEEFTAFLRDLYIHSSFRIMTSEDFFNTLAIHTDHNLEPIISQYFDYTIEMPTQVPTLTPLFTPAPSPTPTPPLRTHIVRSGETISGIAAQYNVAIDSIIKRNHIDDPASIRPGQELMIPYQ